MGLQAVHEPLDQNRFFCQHCLATLTCNKEIPDHAGTAEGL